MAQSQIEKFRSEVEKDQTLVAGLQKFKTTMSELAAATTPPTYCAGSGAGPRPASAGGGGGAPAECTKADLRDPKFTAKDLLGMLLPADPSDSSQSQATCADLTLPGDRQLKVDFATY